jgi:hypothetical protein
MVEEVFMRNLASANIEVEDFATEEQSTFTKPKPVLVHTSKPDFADCVSRRVAEVVDLELANGSMPA